MTTCYGFLVGLVGGIAANQAHPSIIINKPLSFRVSNPGKWTLKA